MVVYGSNVWCFVSANYYNILSNRSNSSTISASEIGIRVSRINLRLIGECPHQVAFVADQF